MDLILALAVAVALYIVYRTTFQGRQFGDGPLLTQIFAAQRDGQGSWGHVLYMPVAGLLWRCLPFHSPIDVLHFLSSGTGAIGAACAYIICRAWNVDRAAALCAALLLGLSPGYWFFSTTVEVHALHAACVGLCACVALFAPWGRPVVAALCVTALLPFVFFSHQSGLLLGPGFVMLAQYVRTRSGHAPFRLRTLLFAIGPLFLASFLFAIWIASRWSDKSLSDFFGHSSDLIDTYEQSFALLNVYEGWLHALGAILPLVLLAVLTRRLRGLSLATTAVMVLPSMIFFIAWGLPERGGYALGTAGFLCAAAATMLPEKPMRALAVGGLLIALQGAVGYTSLKAFDVPAWGEQLERRARSVARVLPDEGTLLSINPLYQYIETALPDVAEKSYYLTMVQMAAEGRTPEEFMEVVGPQIESLMTLPEGRVALDLSYRPLIAERGPRFVPYLDAFDAWLAKRYTMTLYDDEEWPMGLLH